ncbi:hypothetical protein [Actinoplanes subglobosus]|uniref:Lipoprotein n=1 Tax=Actinoplanes subglobosus TaxID=1547892 RepID=A0ABV8J5F0_9ACTN
MKRTFVVAAVAVGLSLTGCAAQDAPALPAASAAPGADAPAAAAMSVEKAGETYAKLSAASNAAREKWMSAPAPTSANLARHKKLAAGAAKATTAFSKGLRKNHWPTDVQPIIDALDEHLQKRAAAYRKASEADTVADYLVAAGKVPVTSSLTGQVREALGLPESAVVEGVSPG